MLNKDKIRLMSDLAIFEKHNEEGVFKVNKFFKSDYIFWHLLMAFIRYTFCALLVIGLYVFFKADLFFYSINLNGLNQILKNILKHYAAGLAVYLIIAFAVYLYRYKAARKGILYYAVKLKRLARRYHYTEHKETER